MFHFEDIGTLLQTRASKIAELDPDPRMALIRIRSTAVRDYISQLKLQDSTRARRVKLHKSRL